MLHQWKGSEHHIGDQNVKIKCLVDLTDVVIEFRSAVHKHILKIKIQAPDLALVLQPIGENSVQVILVELNRFAERIVGYRELLQLTLVYTLRVPANVMASFFEVDSKAC